MAKIPLMLKLKTRARKDIAKAQDIIVEQLFKTFEKAVLHGGTAIWRCYSGNRFSEDVDVYIQKDEKKLEQLFNIFKEKGFVIEKQKIGKNSLFSTLRLSNVSVRFEALFKTAECELKNYEKVDGNFVEIRCLTAESLIKEKISAYQTRLKVRDLYDIFFLLKYANNKEKIKKDLDSLMKKFRTPIDWGDLKVLIIEGLVPRTNEMLVYIGKNY